MIKPQEDLKLSIKALEVYQIEPAIIKNMLSNLQKLTEIMDEAKGISDKQNVIDSFNHEIIAKIRNSQSDAEARRIMIEALKKADRN